MKTTYRIVRSFLLIGIFSFLFGCENHLNAQSSQPNDNTNKESKKAESNPYEGLRNMALATTAEDLQLKLPNEKTVVYGVVLDWNTGVGTATFPIFQTGDASMYTSTGGGIIGGRAHKNVRKAASAFIKKAQTFVDKAKKTENTPIAEANSVRFYFLTNIGKFVAEEKMENFDNKSSKWLELFEEANKVISELQKSSPKNK